MNLRKTLSKKRPLYKMENWKGNSAVSTSGRLREKYINEFQESIVFSPVLNCLSIS